jgi:hypothetical protein
VPSPSREAHCDCKLQRFITYDQHKDLLGVVGVAVGLGQPRGGRRGVARPQLRQQVRRPQRRAAWRTAACRVQGWSMAAQEYCALFHPKSPRYFATAVKSAPKRL